MPLTSMLTLHPPFEKSGYGPGHAMHMCRIISTFLVGPKLAKISTITVIQVDYSNHVTWVYFYLKGLWVCVSQHHMGHHLILFFAPEIRTLDDTGLFPKVSKVSVCIYLRNSIPCVFTWELVLTQDCNLPNESGLMGWGR